MRDWFDLIFKVGRTLNPKLCQIIKPWGHHHILHRLIISCIYNLLIFFDYRTWAYLTIQTVSALIITCILRTTNYFNSNRKKTNLSFLLESFHLTELLIDEFFVQGVCDIWDPLLFISWRRGCCPTLWMIVERRSVNRGKFGDPLFKLVLLFSCLKLESSESTWDLGGFNMDTWYKAWCLYFLKMIPHEMKSGRQWETGYILS